MKQPTVLFSLGTCLAGLLLFASCSKQAIDHPHAAQSGVTTESQSTGLVQTPFGKVPSSQVHLVEPGTEISIIAGRITKINSASGAIVADYGKFDATIKTAQSSLGGMLAHQFNAVHTPVAASGTLGNGYLTYYTIPSGKTLSSFSTTFTVPNNPEYIDTPGYQTYFLWNGLESGDGNTFLQPVLEWGNIDGAEYDVCNWGALNNNYFHGPAVAVSPGTQLTGVMKLTSSKKNSYTYLISFTGYPSANYSETYAEPANTLYECFEAYTSNYLYFPNSQYTTMGSNALILKGSSANQPITWVQSNDGAAITPSGLNTIIGDNGTTSNYVDFYFR